MFHSVLFWIIVVVVVLTLALIALRKRRKRKKCIQGSMKHPGGYAKYHEKTKLLIKKALHEDKTEKTAIAVIDFKGDIRATQRHSISHQIDEILLNKEKIKECVFLVESPGGSVMDYGHLYGEIMRIRNSGIPLTACIDTVAASGGYLVSLPANKIIASPFSIVGSIGVVSFVPNIRKLLQRFDVEPRTFTAGEYKRTVSLTDDATPEQVSRYKEHLTLIHDQFKKALTTFRPAVDPSKVATGEAWLSATTVELKLGLVDELKQSSEYLLELNEKYDLVEWSEEEKKSLLPKLFKNFFGQILSQLLNQLGQLLNELALGH